MDPDKDDAKEAKLVRVSKTITELLLSAPPAFQLAVAISAVLGPFLTLGPFVRRIIELWFQFSEWLRNQIQELIDIDIDPSVWPNVFLLILFAPVVTASVISWIRDPRRYSTVQKRIREILLGYILIITLIKVYFFSLNPKFYLELYSLVGSGVDLLAVLPFLDLILLVTVSVFLCLAKSGLTTKLLIWSAAVILTAHVANAGYNLFLLEGAFNAEKQRFFAFNLYRDGTLSKEAVEEYFRISLDMEYGRYSRSIGILVILSIILCCYVLPRRMVFVATVTVTMLAILVGYSLLDSFLNGAAT